MKVRRGAAVWSLGLAILLPAVAWGAKGESASEMLATLQREAAANSLDQAGLKPWHIQLSAQVFEGGSTAEGVGTIDVWWSGPGNEKRVFAFPNYNGTEIVTADGIYRSAGLESEPMLVAMLVDQYVNPMAPEAKMVKPKPTADTMQLGGLTLPCVMLAHQNYKVAHQPLGFYPAWCTEPGKDALRVVMDDGGVSVERNGIDSFQGKDIATDIRIAVEGNLVATSHLTAIELDKTSTPFTPSAGMVKAQKPVDLKGQKFEDQAARRDDPDFLQSETLKNPGESLTIGMNGGPSGDIEVRVWVGEDGQIRDMLLTSYPDAGMGQVALDAVRQWTFHPWMVEGRAVPYTGVLVFNINTGVMENGIRQ